jgi:hypothetical protein
MSEYEKSVSSKEEVSVMTLGHKVLLLIVFMVSLIVITFLWFVNRFNYHAAHFRASLTHDKETLEAARDRSLKMLSEEAEQLKEQTKDHLHKMEEGLLKQRQEAEAFNDNFLQRQTQLFDKMDSFLGGKKSSSKTKLTSEK